VFPVNKRTGQLANYDEILVEKAAASVFEFKTFNLFLRKSSPAQRWVGNRWGLEQWERLKRLELNIIGRLTANDVDW
jgi:hypothetical protein